ncbi:MAG: aspartate-semialdehyde dehydrogenase [Pseudomonadota bacterium]|nr:aspartate-semialdehyde dehydrogenase [Pseudomonadota bacterium]
MKRIVIVGATGNTGREILQTLAEQGFPAGRVAALASERSAGAVVSYGEDEDLKTSDLSGFVFSADDLVIFAADAKVSETWAPRVTRAGGTVIDTSPRFRLEPDVPLVIPEVNPAGVASPKSRVIACPSPITTQLLTALKPLHDAAGLERVVVTALQSVSGAGKAAMDELFTQTRGVYVNDPMKSEHFTKQIAFNVIPHVDAFMDDGATREEWTLAAEAKKILGAAVKVTATCAHVPVFIGHALAVNAAFAKSLTAGEARQILRRAPGVSVVDHRQDEGYVTPAEIAGEDNVFVSRIREDATVDNGLNLWIVADNLRRGVALGPVRIALALAGQRKD